MAGRRAAYLLFLAASFLYYVFYTWYVSWMLFLLALLLPFLSIGLTLLLTRGCRAVMACDVTQAEREEGFDLRFRVTVKTGAVPAVRIRLHAENLFSGEAGNYKVIIKPGKMKSLHMEGRLCGVVRCSAVRVRRMDLLGIFWLPMPPVKAVEVLLLPEKIPFAGELRLPAPAPEPAGASSGGSGRGEWMDVRGYREGDPLREIHWKLSARTGKLVVREYEGEQSDILHAVLAWQGTAEALDRALGRLLGVAEAAERDGIRLHIFWTSQGRAQRFRNREEMDAALWQALGHTPEQAEQWMEKGPEESMAGSGRVIRITPEAVLPAGIPQPGEVSR